MMEFITSYVAGPVPGGIMVSHGTLFMILVWVGTAQVKGMIQRRRRS